MILGLRGLGIPRADEGAQDPDILLAHAEHAGDAAHFEPMGVGAAAMAQRVHRATGFSRFRSWTGRVTPRLVAASDGGLTRATLGRPFHLRPFQAPRHPSIFAVSTVCSLEFFICAARGRGFLKSLSVLNVARHCA
jgi:hypothetical protein